MARLTSCFLLVLFLNTGAGNELFARQMPAGTAETRGAWLARHAEDRDTSRDARMKIRMRLYDRQNRLRERALTIATLRGGPGRPAPSDRTLVRFTAPADIAGTGFLVWEQAAGDDERFLFLPSLSRVRRIAGSQTQESFVGSDFTYEDIGGREFANYGYTLLDENAAWKAPDGISHPAYRLESKSHDANARFPRVVSLVRKDNFVVVHAELYNRRGEPQKAFDARRIERVRTYWTVLEMLMTDVAQRTRTELLVENVEYDIGLTADDFSRRELERGGIPGRAIAPAPLPRDIR